MSTQKSESFFKQIGPPCEGAVYDWDSEASYATGGVCCGADRIFPDGLAGRLDAAARPLTNPSGKRTGDHIAGRFE